MFCMYVRTFYSIPVKHLQIKSIKVSSRKYISMTSTLEQLVSPTIQNTQYPNCVSCKFYQPDMSCPNWESPFTTCARFGEKNLITGKVVFDGTGICRHTKSKCGIEGKHYEFDPRFSQRAWRHRFFTNRSGIFFTSLLIANIGYWTWIPRDT